MMLLYAGKTGAAQARIVKEFKAFSKRGLWFGELHVNTNDDVTGLRATRKTL
jgi:hypothetical protein